MMKHMRHMGNSGKIAIGAFLAALALLVLTGVTLHAAVLLCFLAASAVAYVACVTELVLRRRHRTLVASGIGSVFFIAFGIAFLRMWGLAFNPDPEALSTHVDSEHPDLYFYLAAAFGAATLVLLFAGTVLPARSSGASYAPRRRPASAGRGASSGSSRGAATGSTARGASSRTSASRPTERGTVARPAAARPVGRAAASAPPARVPAPRTTAAKRPAAGGGTPAAKPAGKAPAKPPARPTARSTPRR
jgi:hypothetical protein